MIRKSGSSYWLIMLLVGSSIISVSPNSSSLTSTTTTTATTSNSDRMPTTNRGVSTFQYSSSSSSSSSKQLNTMPTTPSVGITSNLFGKIYMNHGLNSFNHNNHSYNNHKNSNNYININNNNQHNNPIQTLLPNQQRLNQTLAANALNLSSRTMSIWSFMTNQQIHHTNQDNNFRSHQNRKLSNDGDDGSHPNHNLMISNTLSHYNDQSQHYLQPHKRKRRPRRNAELNDDSAQLIDPCIPFTIGDEDQKTFYSPDFPNNYPKDIDCIRTLEAQEGQLVRLDFRNTFDIEDKDGCKFDYLEIRDGPYGFSTLLGTYCGQNFPPIITSKERHLWLHFHSDESIEYSGFTAVFEFINRPEGAISTNLDCIIRKDGFEGWVNHTDVPEYVHLNSTAHKIPIDCMWIIEVKKEWKIQTKFPEFELSKPNDCESNFIDIFTEKTTMDSRLKNFCGSAGEAVQSKTNILHVRFYAAPIAVQKSKFAMLYTAYRDKGTGACEEDEYDCEDASCISKELRCNKRGNCKFQWDEENCENEATGQSEHVTIIIVVFGLILGGMIASFLFNCTRKLVRDQKIIREHIRQSKESKLDEMGRASAKRSGENLSVKLSPREKHSQTSLQILDDVSNRFYREVIPVSVQTSRLDIKSDTILRQHHDMVVQTSLGGGTMNGSSTPDQNSSDNGLDGIGTCDMGCQTRESLFQPTAAPIIRQKSILSSSSSPSPNQSQSAIRFSTFGYDTTTNNPPASNKTKQQLSRQSTINNRTSQAIELDDLHHHQHHQQQQQHQHQQQQQQIQRISIGGGGGGDLISGGNRQIDMSLSARPPEICHHHHQHQKHLQQQQQKQQQQQQQQYQLHQHQHHHSHQQQSQPQQSTGVSGGGGNVVVIGPKTTKQQQQKVDESKVFIDIRNSAPDVIIMTSH